MVDFGLLLPTRGIILQNRKNPNGREVLDLASMAEQHGFGSVWVGDSVVARPRLEAFSTMAAIAMLLKKPTTQVGTAVYLPALRHPLHLAHHVLTLATLAPGRLVWAVGIGAGVEDYYHEWRSCGVPPSERMGRLEETIDMIRGLITGEPLEYEGKYFKIEKSQFWTPPVPPKIWFATGHGRFLPRQHYRVARWGDGAMMNLDTPAEFRKLKDAISEECVKLNRDPKSLEYCMYMSIHLGDDQAKATEEGEGWLTKYYIRNWWNGRWGPFGPPQLIIDRMNEFLDAGVQRFVVRFAANDQPAQFRRFTEEIIPHFNGTASVAGR